MKPIEQNIKRPATDPSGPTGRLAGWLANIELDDIPESVRERARHLVLDGIACALVGAQLPWSRTAVEAVVDLEGDGIHRIIGWGRTTSAPAAALLNGTFIQGFELDDFHPGAPLHSNSLVVPSLLATAERIGNVTGRQFLLGAICGYEVGPRVGLALHGAEMLTRGWHSGAVFGTHASAAAAGKLRGFDAAAFEDALGLAGTQSAGLMAAQFEAMSKRMHHGFAARNGLYAAGLAAHGYTGIKRVFERDYGGFLSTFGEGHAPDASQVSKDLGSTWHTEAINIKRHAAMGGLLAAIDAILAFKRQHSFSADDVEAIDVDLAAAIFHHGGWAASRPLTPIGAQMNLAYAVAITVIDGAALIHQFSPTRINEDDVWSLMKRVQVHHDERFDADGAEARLATRIVVKLKSGQHFEKLTRHPDGEPMAPVLNADIVDKYRALTAGIVDTGRRDAIERIVLGLDASTDIGELLDLLEAPVASAL
ncbi:MmgE/PrpD family protein [Burkholderia metallica]|uniref:MmgE/PrpD family protein n=1 Tax=Burkholderia metallica TaxID=488729 RepID=UPI00157B733C|nr:MmgE/PrpD family protein [Burkholderia metallica]NTZ83625.1 MmgE/PrpD family protein [Burkholderia metallica]